MNKTLLSKIAIIACLVLGLMLTVCACDAPDNTETEGGTQTNAPTSAPTEEPTQAETDAEDEISGYNEVTDLVTDGEINGIPAAWYRTVEEYQDVAFNTLTYILDAGNEYVELVFWLDGETADAEADAIIRTLNRDDGDAPAGAEAPEASLEEAPTAETAAADAPVDGLGGTDATGE